MGWAQATLLHLRVYIVSALFVTLLSVTTARLHGQVVDQASPPSPRATISLDRGTLNAGESFRLTIGLIPSLPAQTSILVTFSGQNDAFSASGPSNGTTSLTLTVTVPKDLPPPIKCCMQAVAGSPFPFPPPSP